MLGRGDALGDELGVLAYGPHASQLARRVAGQIRTWADEHRASTTAVEVYPADAAIPAADEVIFGSARDHVQVVLRNQPAVP